MIIFIASTISANIIIFRKLTAVEVFMNMTIFMANFKAFITNSIWSI